MFLKPFFLLQLECVLVAPKLMVRLKQQPKFNGAPTLIFVAGAALRVADITRVLRKFKGEKGGDVAKLFAKHLKLQDHITYLRRTKVGVAVGTPERLGQLLEAGKYCAFILFCR